MVYTIKNHPTKYAGTMFRSRLEARWAAFFDLAGWECEYEPLDLFGWTPDFRVTFPCGHSECSGKHILLVEVKPYYSVHEFDGHPCMHYPYGQDAKGRQIPADSSACFGANPHVSHWDMSHGAGGGYECVSGWVDNVDTLWKDAGNITRFNPITHNS